MLVFVPGIDTSWDTSFNRSYLEGSLEVVEEQFAFLQSCRCVQERSEALVGNIVLSRRHRSRPCKMDEADGKDDGAI